MHKSSLQKIKFTSKNLKIPKYWEPDERNAKESTIINFYSGCGEESSLKAKKC